MFRRLGIYISNLRGEAPVETPQAQVLNDVERGLAAVASAKRLAESGAVSDSAVKRVAAAVLPRGLSGDGDERVVRRKLQLRDDPRAESSAAAETRNEAISKHASKGIRYDWTEVEQFESLENAKTFIKEALPHKYLNKCRNVYMCASHVQCDVELKIVAGERSGMVRSNASEKLRGYISRQLFCYLIYVIELN